MLIRQPFGGLRGRLAIIGLCLLTAFAVAPAAHAADSVLVGTENVGSPADNQAFPGMAMAYKTTAAATGVATSISVFLAWDSDSTALEFGLYADENGRPTTLLTSGRSEAPIAGTWETVQVPAAEIEAGRTYWIGLLNPATAEGTLKWHDRAAADLTPSEGAFVDLNALPDQWFNGFELSDGPLSGYVSGVATPTEPELAVTPSALSFFSTLGAGNPVPKTLAVSDLAGGALQYTATDNAPWLSVSPQGGTTPADLNVSVDVTDLAPGDYTAEVRIEADAEGAPRIVPVTLTVNAPRTDNGLVGAWAFNEPSGDQARDFSTFNNPGVLAGPVRVPGRFGGGLQFDGLDDWVTVADSDSLDLSHAMTLEAWVKPTATGSAWRTVVLKEQNAQLTYALYANTDQGRPAGHVFTDGDTGLTGPNALPLNEWTHLATTWDGSTLRLFVDAAEVASMPLAAPAVTSAGVLRIGGNGVWAEWFQGIIDEVRVYDRALSPTEIASDRDTAIDPVTDTTAPTTSAATSPEPNAAGWHKAATTVKIEAADDADGSGIAAINYRAGGAQTVAPTTVEGASVEIPVSAEGITEFTYSATDKAGNTGPERVLAVKVDTTAPVVRCDAPDGAWHGTNVTVVCNSDEQGSGLANTSDAVFGLTTTVGEGQESADATTGSRTVCDLAGNCADAAPIAGNKVDRKAPALKLPAAQSVNATSPQGAAVTFDVSATDGADAAPSVTCTPGSGGTLPIGTTTVSCTATDHAGNAATGSFTVKVLGAPEQLVKLTNDMRAMFKLPALSVPLATALQDAAARITQRRPSLACAAMNVFNLAVKLVPTSFLSADRKATLTADATRIRAVIGC
jgi:hypothetical protein